MPEYEQGALRGTSIALLPLASTLPSPPELSAPSTGLSTGLSTGPSTGTASPDDLDPQAAYFTEEGRTLFQRLFGLSLQEVAAAEVLDLAATFEPAGTPFAPHTLPVPSGDSLRVVLPGGPVELPGERSADFLLLVDRLTFAPRTETTQAGMMGSTKMRNSFFLGARCQYVLYDNRAGRVAAYGTFESETRTLDPTSRTPFQVLFEELAVHIVERSPIALSRRFQPSAASS
jgi:hypothetical protein